jgi:hypothetical protein
MNTEDNALTAQPAHVIQRTDTPSPIYFSEKIGRDFGQPSGGWTDDVKLATQMTQEQADHRLETGLASMAPHCKVVAL